MRSTDKQKSGENSPKEMEGSHLTVGCSHLEVERQRSDPFEGCFVPYTNERKSNQTSRLRYPYLLLWRRSRRWDDIGSNREMELDRVCHDGERLRLVPELQDDRDAVELAIRHRGSAIQYASARLRGDPELVSLAFQGHTWNDYLFQFIPKELHHLSVKKLYSEEHYSYQENRYQLKEDQNRRLAGDPQYILNQVQKGCLSILTYASGEMRRDKTFMLNLVKANGLALEYASEILQGDEEVVIAAVSNCGYAIRYASPRCRSNEGILIIAIHQDGRALEFAPCDMKDNNQMVSVAVNSRGKSLAYASKALRNNFDIVMDAVKNDPYALEYASSTLGDNREILLTAIKGNASTIRFATRELYKEIINDLGLLYSMRCDTFFSSFILARRSFPSQSENNGFAAFSNIDAVTKSALLKHISEYAGVALRGRDKNTQSMLLKKVADRLLREPRLECNGDLGGIVLK